MRKIYRVKLSELKKLLREQRAQDELPWRDFIKLDNNSFAGNHFTNPDNSEVIRFFTSLEKAGARDIKIIAQ